MNANVTTVWANCLSHIKRHVPPQSFKTWFEPIRPVRLAQNALTIQVPNKIYYEWLEDHYLDVMKASLRKELGENARLEYQIPNGKPKHPARKTSNIHKDDDNLKLRDAGAIQNPFVIPGIKKMEVNPQLNPKYTFDTYIEGDCNQLARSAGLAVAKEPGTTHFNPLFIFGNVGLGKTHLAQAIGHEVLQRFPEKIVLYVSTSKFTNQVIESIKNNATTDLVNFYQTIDVLIIDDIQFLARRKKTQEIFFNIFNQLHQHKKQLVLTSDRPPKDLQDIEERLISRFKWGLSADLGVPDFETRMAILESKMMREGIEVPENVIEFISFNIKENIRELEGVLVSLIAQSSLNKRNIDLALAKEVIQNFVSNIHKEITVDFIQNLVAEHFKIPVETLKSKTRKRQIVIARQLSMFLAKKMTRASLKKIGETFGGRDHSTVIHALRAVENMLDTDPAFKQTLEELSKKITLSMHGNDEI